MKLTGPFFVVVNLLVNLGLTAVLSVVEKALIELVVVVRQAPNRVQETDLYMLGSLCLAMLLTFNYVLVY